MALTFAKKKKPAQTSSESDDQAEDQTPKTQTKKTQAGSAKGASWMKTGKAAAQALAEEEAKAELAKEQAGKMWRFWMPANDDRQITFLSGEVNEDGMLDIPMFHEHQVKLGGKWQNFVCTQDTEGYCPLCAKGESKPYIVGVMTVIDHSAHVIKSGANAGKTIQNSRKLFVAKKQTIRALTKLALKRDGLTGCTFDVSRTDDKSASVGNQFDFDSKRTLEELRAAYSLKAEDVTPADVEEEVTYHSADELAEMGVGPAASGPGYEKNGYDKDKLKGEM